MPISLFDRQANHRGHLQVRPSSIPGDVGLGLFTTATIPRDAAIGLWSGREIPSADFVDDAYGMEVTYLNDTNVVLTPRAVDGSVDLALHPFAASNEPAPGTVANMYPRIEDHEDLEGRAILVVVFYAARTIPAGRELVWHYGAKYTRRDYRVGRAAKPRDPPWNPRRVARALASGRTDVAVWVDDDRTEEGSDDSDWE